MLIHSAFNEEYIRTHADQRALLPNPKDMLVICDEEENYCTRPIGIEPRSWHCRGEMDGHE